MNVQSIVHNSLVSPNTDERIDAARNLGALRVGDTMVLYALRERLKNDDEERVVYEAAKSLVTLGTVTARAVVCAAHIRHAGSVDRCVGR